MRIFIEQNTRKAMSVLGIEDFPFSEQTLKLNYKRLIFENHPDRNNGSEKSKEKTRRIIEAYERIKNLATPEPTDTEAVEIKKRHEKEKLDMFTFWEKCENCNGTGKTVTKQYIGDFLDYLFSHKKRKPKYIVGTCFKCKGTGEIKIEVFNPVIPKGAVMT